MMKKIILFISLIASALTASADSYFYAEDYEIKQARLGDTIMVPIKAHFEARLNAFQAWFRLPDGLTLYDVWDGPGLDVPYFNSKGVEKIRHVDVSLNTTNNTLIGVIMDTGYWDPTGEGDYVSYGCIKWEAGEYDCFFYLEILVNEDFNGGEMEVETIVSSTKDTRGGTVKNNGDDGVSFFKYSQFTVEAVIPGDVNCDGQISIADATMLIDYLLSGDESNLNLDAADFTGDGEVTIKDVTSIIDNLLSV